MILCYHCVTPRPDLISADPWKMFLDAGVFGKQLDFLQKNYNLVSLQDYLEARRANRPLPPHSVILTFDDGKRNFLTVIAPFLNKLNIPATTFVVVGNTEKAMAVNGSAVSDSWKPEDDFDDLSWKDIAFLMKNKKIEVGSHTLTHPVLPAISADEAENELNISYQNLLRKTKCENIAIAYPHGQTCEEVIKIAETAGYSCGLTNADAGNDFKTDLFRLNRTVINSDDDLPLFAARVAGITWRMNKIKNFLRPLKTRAGLSNERKLNFREDFIKNTIL